MISLCMIVRNENNNLESCLSRIQPFVDEIVVVDTGSTDNTIDIAKKFTVNVHRYEWDGNFSNARNFSISKAHNDWVLVLDADEFAEIQDANVLRTFASDARNLNVIGRIKLLNILDRDEQITKQSEYIKRFFNRKFYFYNGAIHEQLLAIDGKTAPTMKLELRVEHIGYTQASISVTDKLDRNLSMLKTALGDCPNDQYLLYQLGKTLFMMHQWADASNFFENALEQNCDHRLEYMEDLVETYGYSLLNDEQYTKALALEQYLPYYEYLTDFRFLWALILMNNALFNEAIAVFETCLKGNVGRTEGINSWLSAYNIGVIYEMLGRKLQALRYYSMCPNYTPAQNRINKFANLNKK